MLDIPDSDNVRSPAHIDTHTESDHEGFQPGMHKFYKREHICYGGKIIEKITYLRYNADGTTTKCSVFGEEIDLKDVFCR